MREQGLALTFPAKTSPPPGWLSSMKSPTSNPSRARQLWHPSSLHGSTLCNSCQATSMTEGLSRGSWTLASTELHDGFPSQVDSHVCGSRGALQRASHSALGWCFPCNHPKEKPQLPPFSSLDLGRHVLASCVWQAAPIASETSLIMLWSSKQRWGPAEDRWQETRAPCRQPPVVPAVAQEPHSRWWETIGRSTPQSWIDIRALGIGETRKL